MEYTEPILLQHRKHFTREIFDVAPIEPEVDLFLAFWWIAKHPPQGAWDTNELRFSSPNCLSHCISWETADFLLTLDETIISHPEVRTIGYVSTVSEVGDQMAKVSDEFRDYLAIMGKEVAEALPEHRSYDCKIDLKPGTTAPWGPIYPLSEK